MQTLDNFYYTYNARHLKPSEVAASFIWSSNFEKLIQNNHSIILGARGCGKTTLMKMLTIPALHSWEDKNSDNIRKNIPFYAVYISTDIYWDVKNQTYSSQLQNLGHFADIISHFSVNSNVFKALCETFKHIIEIELKDFSEEKEMELCLVLVKAWKLPPIVPKLKYVINALNERIDFVNQFIQDLIFNPTTEDKLQHFDFFNLSFETSIEYIIPSFEYIYHSSQGKKWALCFDELEFAPIWLQQKLFSSLRSRTQYLLYKLSASPILPVQLENALKREYAGTPGNDVQMIKMWSSKDNEQFSRKIIDSLLKKKNINIGTEAFFGTNEIYNKNQNSYKQGSDFYNQMLELIEKDDSFRDFLSNNNIEIKNPLPKNNKEKDTLFRKIKPIVYFRNYYLDYNKKLVGSYNTKLRSRKSSELYSGVEVIIKICDGNPRWLIGVVNSILAKSNIDFADKQLQFQELHNTAKRFSNVISNIPVNSIKGLSIGSLIEKIAQYFNIQVLGSHFNMDPKGTFEVDENPVISDEIISMIEKGTSQGAFILIESDDSSFDFEVKNKRFKLAYLYSLLHKLPLRMYPDTKLSDIITNNEQSSSSQIPLFN